MFFKKLNHYNQTIKKRIKNDVKHSFGKFRICQCNHKYYLRLDLHRKYMLQKSKKIFTKKNINQIKSLQQKHVKNDMLNDMLKYY